ncbi:CV_2116 domain-containing protein [Nitrospira sp. KM1]|uniref:CV_2116 domain-containing protein n=1 Tax=Nitrospira sp. KM1 TaxID=1936990 RepID=UPI001565E3C5|nr:hypothetical protein [Nitrospira sp. KM1]
MAKTVQYHYYTIRSLPWQLVSTHQWKPHIVITWQDDGRTHTREFSPAVTYQSEEEADVHSVTYGQRVVDGKVRGQSLT